MNFLSKLLTFLLFIGPVVLAVFGWPVEGNRIKNVHLYPAYYILSVYLIYAVLTKKISLKISREALLILVIVFLWYWGNKLVNRQMSKIVLVNSMALPAMYFIFFSSLRDIKIKKNVQRIILILYIINCLVAVYERMTLGNLFPIQIIRYEDEIENSYYANEFRSNALIGYPLTNALIMSIIMVFILISDMRLIKKMALYCIGLFSLFCFNARASIMISVLSLFLYLIRPFVTNKTFSIKNIIFTFTFVLISMAFVSFLFDAGFGGRFEARGNFSEDSSVLSRLDVFSLLLKFDISELLWGVSGDIRNISLSILGSIHVENWFILSSLQVGVVITTVVTVLFVPVFSKSLKPYSKYESLLIIMITIGLASTNNSLACGAPALSICFVCAYAFDRGNNLLLNRDIRKQR